MITKQELQNIKSLATKKGRLEQGVFMCEGEKICQELIQNNFPVSTIIYTEQADTSLVGSVVRSGAQSHLVGLSIIERISQLKSPPSMIVLCPLPKWKLTDTKEQELIIALDSVQDPGNLGTIIRLADWFGVKRIVCSEDCADALSPKVIQATMGAIARVEIHYTTLERWLSQQKVPIFGTFLNGDNIYTESLPKGGILVMGNEGRGISQTIENMISRKLYIPPYPIDSQSVESLNVAVATSICLSEFRRPK